MRLLDQVQIAKPCPANWDEMTGNDQVRHCSLCRLNVYNVAAMTGDEAEQLIRKHEGKICLQIYRREDGTVITRDCPKGLRAFRQRAAKRMVLAFSMVLSAVGCGQTAERLKADFGFPTEPPAPATRGKVVMGRPAVIVYPTSSTSTKENP